MKKLTVFSLLVATVAIFSYCGSSKKAAAKTEAAKTETKVATVYAANVETAMLNYCAPCHFPAKGGNKKPLDTYTAVHDNIDDIIKRIELNPTDRGFMPFKKTAKLDEATINLFKQWKADGAVEK